jgi:archaemetzincin
MRQLRTGSSVVLYDRLVFRRLLVALGACGLWLIALITACDSGHRRGDPAPGAEPAPIPIRLAAIGYTATLPPELRRAFDPTGFEPMPLPEPDDWLAQHPEKPQLFDDYLRAAKPVPDARRKVIYLLPIGSLPATGPRRAQLANNVPPVFMLEVRTLPAVKVSDVTAKTRINEMTKKRQLLAPEVLGWLRTRLPDDAFGLVAVSMEDLYPDPTWNFVFGQASLKDRVGVQSLARQDPAFFGAPRPRGWQTIARRRATWTLLHEISHMFGLTHCTFWRCVVAGANSQEEADRSPLHACPVCLRKLYSAIRFDPAAREDALASIFAELGLRDEAAWSAARATWIRSGVRAVR